MSLHNKKKADKPFLLFLVLLGFTVLLCILIFLKAYNSRPNYVPASSTFMKENWLCTSSEGSYMLDTLPETLKNTSRLPLTMEHVLPSVLLENATILFQSFQQDVAVYVNHELIYTYNNKESRFFGKASPNHWNFVEIPDTAAGKTVKIELTSPYAPYSRHIPSILYGTYSDLAMQQMRMVIPSYVTCIVLFYFGVLVIFSSHILKKENQSITIFKYLGWFTVLLAIWMRTSRNLPSYLMGEPQVAQIISASSLMLCPLPYLLFVQQRMHEKFQWIYKVFFSLFVCNFILCTTLHLLNIYSYVETVFITHILVIFLIVILIAQYVNRVISHKQNSPFFSLFAFSALSLSILWELFAFYTGSYEDSGLYFRLGMILYIMRLSMVAIHQMISFQTVNAQAREVLLQKQIKMMLSHVQPHFLFNSLGAIQSFIKKSPDTASKMILDFSAYLRSSISAWKEQPLIPFSAEISNIRAFTDIQQIRFQNAFQVIFDISTDSFKVPLLSIRPLVQNAVNHGARKSSAPDSYVKIRSYETNGNYYIEIIDNGPGFEVSKSLKNEDSTSGLYRCREILERSLNATLQIRSAPGEGTCVTICIPKTKESGEIVQ